VQAALDLVLVAHNCLKWCSRLLAGPVEQIKTSTACGHTTTSVMPTHGCLMHHLCKYMYLQLSQHVATAMHISKIQIFYFVSSLETTQQWIAYLCQALDDGVHHLHFGSSTCLPVFGMCGMAGWGL
jgi:hypothetical protein